MKICTTINPVECVNAVFNSKFANDIISKSPLGEPLIRMVQITASIPECNQNT